jgi:hypothetical protein
MKHVCHLVIIVCSTCVLASTSLGQQQNNGARGTGLSLRANVTPASIIELSSNSNNAEIVETNLTTVRSVRVRLLNPDMADIVKQTEVGTLYLTRIEILVRFSGYEKETATVLITSDADNSMSREALREGAGDDTSHRLAPGQTIELEGIRSGARIVRYVGFLMKPGTVADTEKTHFTAVLTYKITHP